MRHRESGEPGLRLRADAGRALVADLAARAGRRAGKRRDRRRMVVRLDLHQDVRRSRCARIAAVGVGIEARAPSRLRSPPRCPSRRRPCPAGCAACVWRIIANRLLSCAHAVDDPVGVEDLVPAVLGVRLREHHQLDVGRIAAERGEIRRRGSRSRPAPARGPSSAFARSSAARPLREQRNRRRAAAARRARTARAQRRVESSTASVIRSWSSGSSASRSAAASVAPPRVADPVADAALDARRPRRARNCARCRWPSTTTAKSCRDAARRAAKLAGVVRGRRRADRRSGGARASRARRAASSRATSRRNASNVAEMPAIACAGRDGRECREELGDPKRRGGRASAQRKEFGHRKVAGRKDGLYAGVPPRTGAGHAITPCRTPRSAAA